MDNPDGADNQSEFGKLVLHSLPTTETKEMVVSYLSRIVKNVPAEKLAEKIMTTPYVLSKNIAVKKGERIAQNLRDLGARAEFVPHDPDARGIEPLSEIAIMPKFESLQRLPEQINPPQDCPPRIFDIRQTPGFGHRCNHSDRSVFPSGLAGLSSCDRKAA